MTLQLATKAKQQRSCQTHWEVRSPAFQSNTMKNPPILGLQPGTFPAWLQECRLTEEKKKQQVKSFLRWKKHSLAEMLETSLGTRAGSVYEEVYQKELIGPAPQQHKFNSW